jgi:hypothetical protein
MAKSDTFLLLRIYDLLDQLGKAQYFATLDLADTSTPTFPQEDSFYHSSQSLEFPCDALWVDEHTSSFPTPYAICVDGIQS